MNEKQVAELVKNIVAMYSYITPDNAYLNIWRVTTKHADFEATMARFYRYISDPQCRHAAPLPADIVVNRRADQLNSETDKMRQWETAAKKYPVRREDFKSLGGVLNG
jgi:hypothetical protein